MTMSSRAWISFQANEGHIAEKKNNSQQVNASFHRCYGLALYWLFVQQQKQRGSKEERKKHRNSVCAYLSNELIWGKVDCVITSSFGDAPRTAHDMRHHSATRHLYSFRRRSRTIFDHSKISVIIIVEIMKHENDWKSHWLGLIIPFWHWLPSHGRTEMLRFMFMTLISRSSGTCMHSWPQSIAGYFFFCCSPVDVVEHRRLCRDDCQHIFIYISRFLWWSEYFFFSAAASIQHTNIVYRAFSVSSRHRSHSIY